MKKFGLLSMSALLMCACSSSDMNELDPSNQETALLSISTSVLTQNTKAGVTKTTGTGDTAVDGVGSGPVMGTTLAKGSEIGVCVYAAGGFTVYPGGQNNLNLKWTAGTTTDEKQSWTYSEARQFAFGTAAANVYAYFPYTGTERISTEDENTAYSINVTSGYTDYMYGKSENTDGTLQSHYAKNVAATIKLNHAMAMVAFTFVKEGYTGPCLLNSIVLKNLPASATMSVDGGITPATAAATASLTLKKYNQTGYTTISSENFTSGLGSFTLPTTPLFHALVIPQSGGLTMAEGNTHAIITIDNLAYTVSLELPTAGGNAWVAGKVHTYNLKMTGKNELTVSSVTVNQWTLGNSAEIEI